jgi:hypothetical protein
MGVLRASASFRTRDSRFTPMDRLDNVFENDRWNQAAGLTVGAGELTLQYDPVTAVSLSAKRESEI